MRIPTSSYRFQFRKDFGFAEARGGIEYQRGLGVVDFEARAGISCISLDVST
jgi:maltooligosyltrehalose synthase